MSISLFGTVTVPADTNEEAINKIETAINRHMTLRDTITIRLDKVERFRPLFASEDVVIEEMGLVYPNVKLSFWCDLGAEPFHYGEGYDEALAVLTGLGYKVTRQHI